MRQYDCISSSQAADADDVPLAPRHFFSESETSRV